MKLKNSVKLSALSLSLVALAVTSCGGSKSNNDAKTEEKKENANQVVKPQGGQGEAGKTSPVAPKEEKKELITSFDAKTVQRLHISKNLSVPQFGCADLVVEIEQDGGKKTAIHPTSPELRVTFIGKNSDGFKFENGKVCTVEQNAAGKTVPAVGAEGTVHVVLVNNSGVRADAPLKVEDREFIKSVQVNTGNSRTPSKSIAALQSELAIAKRDLRVAEANANTLLTNLGYDRLTVEDLAEKIGIIDHELKNNTQFIAKYKALREFQTDVAYLKNTYIEIQGPLGDAGLSSNVSITRATLEEITRSGLNNLITAVQQEKDVADLAYTDIGSGEADKAAKDAAKTKLDAISKILDLLKGTPAVSATGSAPAVPATLGIKGVYDKFATPTTGFDALGLTVTGYAADKDISFGSINSLLTNIQTAINALDYTKLEAVQTKLQAVQTKLQAVQTAQTALNDAIQKQQNPANADVVSVPAGSKATITVTKTLSNGTTEPVTKNDKVVIKDNSGNELVVEVLADNSGTVQFTAPKKPTNTVNDYKILVSDVEDHFSVKVTDAVAKSINKLVLNDGSDLNPLNVLNLDQSYHASVVIAKSDSSTIDLTHGSHNHTVGASLSGSGFTASFVDKISPTGMSLPHYLNLTPNVKTGFVPHELTVSVDGTNVNFPFYVDSKPTISSVGFSYNNSSEAATNAIRLAIAGSDSSNKSQYCAKLAAVKYTLDGSAQAHSVANLGTDINVTVNGAATASKVFNDWFVCANKQATEGQQVAVTIASAYDASVVKVENLTVGKVFRANKFAAVNSSGVLLTTAPISISKTSPYSLSMVYMNSNDTPSTDAVANLALRFELGEKSPFEVKYDTIAKVYKVSLKSGAFKATSDVLLIPNTVSSEQPHENSVNMIRFNVQK